MQRKDLNYADPQIKNVLFTYWRIKVHDLQFVDIGNIAFGFSLTQNTGDRYFLKIYPSSKMVANNLKLLTIRLSALHELRNFYNISNLSYPILASNDHLWMEIDGFIFILYEHIEGIHPKRLPAHAIASLLTLLHQVPLDHFPNFPKETFDIRYAEQLFDRLSTPAKNNVWAEKAKINLIKEYPVLQKILSKLIEIKNLLDPNKDTLVLTHGDIHCFNILKAKQQKISLIDWDLMLLAPPERDLWFLYQGSQKALTDYLHQRIDYSLNTEMCHFYMLSRFLMDIHHFIERLLDPNLSQVQKKQDYHNIQHYLKDRLPLLKRFQLI